MVDYKVFISIFKPGEPLKPNEVYGNRSKKRWGIKFDIVVKKIVTIKFNVYKQMDLLTCPWQRILQTTKTASLKADQ